MLWLQQEFETFKWVITTYWRVWLIPLLFFIFSLGILIFLNLKLSHYFETRPETALAPFLDQVIITYYEKMNHKILRKFLGGVSKSMLTLNEAIIDVKKGSVHDKFHRTLILSGFCLLKIAKISLNSSFFPKPIKR